MKTAIVTCSIDAFVPANDNAAPAFASAEVAKTVIHMQAGAVARKLARSERFRDVLFVEKR